MSDLTDTNSRLLTSWGKRIGQSGSLAACLIAVKPGTDPEELHICFPARTPIEEMVRLLTAALKEAQENGNHG